MDGTSTDSILKLRGDTVAEGGLRTVTDHPVDFELNLNKHTLSVEPDAEGNYAGSSGTKTQAMQLLKDATITIENGTVQGNDGPPPTKMVIQNYSNLTLKDVTLIGKAKDSYVLSNNYGEIHLKGKTKIEAAGDNVAFDVWYGLSAVYDEPGVTVYIDDPTVEIIGKVEYGHQGRIKDEDQFHSHAHLYVCADYPADKLADLESRVSCSTSGHASDKYVFQMNDELGYYELVLKPADEEESGN